MAVAVAALGVAGGCLPTEPDNEALWIVVPLVESSAITLGDTLTLHAQASRCFQAGCPGVSSYTASERFQWESRTPDVASVESGRLLRAHAVGEARLRVTFLRSGGEQTAELTLQVVAPGP